MFSKNKIIGSGNPPLCPTRNPHRNTLAPIVPSFTVGTPRLSKSSARSSQSSGTDLPPPDK
ncbi:hypothetical protein Ga0061063_0654 [Gulbenkiania indica]|uniref:Uncharacterized protein n=2 Tax=Gulbenkiania TaxID=397456 RepID=A0A0K6GTE1_9NEIS|nr:hypothetical protein EV669_10449 [Gulbenkiania mobilis]CUA81808.1 hypothetical protein Ga0061063_0654 [Gulbenkiania indica]